MTLVWKLVFFVGLAAVVFCLAVALRELITDNPATKENLVRSLSWRIGISLGIFALLIGGYSMGWIQPHGLMTG